MVGPIEQSGFSSVKSYEFQNPGMALAAINSIDSVIQIMSDVNVVLDQVMDAVLEIFASSRAWLFHPCNPELTFFDVTFESTTAEYPGAKALKKQVPMTDDMADYCRRALSAKDVPKIDPPQGQPVTNDIAIRFNVKSMLFMALRPKLGEPWMFGLHQCDSKRVWTSDDKHLFHMIGQRITTCIDNFLYVRRLKESESLLNYSQQLSSTGSFIWDLDTDDLQWSKNMYHIHGIDKNFFEGNLTKVSQELIHPDDRDHVRTEIERMIEAGRVWSMDFRIIRSDGEERIMRSIGEYTLDKNDKPLKCIGVHQDITDQKQSQKALKESEFRFRSFVENANDIVYAVSPEGLFTYVSPNWLEFMGEPADAAIGNSFKYYVHPEDVHLCQEFLDKVLTSGQKQSSVEYRVKHTDGSWHWHVSNGSPMRDMDGNITGYVGIARDVTEQKQTENALRESEEKFSKAFQSAPLLMTITSVEDGRFLDVNDAFVLLTGYSRKTAIGSRSTEIGFAQIDERDRMVDILKTEGRVRNLELKVRRADGSQMVCLYSTEILNLNGQERLLSTAIDITDQKQSEKAILESEERYRKLVNTAPYGIQLTDKEGKIVFSNPAHHKIQGYADGELIGKYIWELMADDQHRLKAKSFYQKLIKERPLPEVYFNRDLTKDGREIDVQVNWDYILNAEGEVEGIISIISDITKQRALELSIQQAQKMESIGNLAGGIAHDFNNILFPIIGMSEILIEDLPPDSPERENVEQIYRAGQRGSDLVKQILAFSRQSEHKMIPTRLQNILEEVIKLSRSTIPAYIEIDQEVQQNCGMVLADPSQILQIGMNIITNAYHAVEGAGGKISIALCQKEVEGQDSIDKNLSAGNYAVISVSDTGHGISKELIGKIFDPYFTTKEQGKGTGLGLAVAYGIVKEHRGDIKVYSEIGKGSTFDIYLPLMKKHNLAESIPVAEGHIGGNERILLVDDEESVASLVKQMLERMGYKVTSRLHSVEALEAFRASPSSYDLVITDMSMPIIPGDTLARKIRSIRPGVPVIVCTGFSERIYEDNFEQMGIDGLLMKPIMKSKLAKTVRKVLDKAKSGSQQSMSLT